ncbi:hypothetical protein FJY94_03595 [Candidatus Kaiserbacteria bacterium]|nr:hypothetical protein [Candidatus Kaiserbacteria bacterium]
MSEDFDGPKLDLSRWRVWQQDPDQTTVQQERGQLFLTSRGPVGHNGLFGLTTVKYKDLVLVGEMDIRSKGPAPHRLALHLCGGDGARSPDHWVEIDLVDLGEKARFSPIAALPIGLDRHQDKFLDLPHPVGHGFLCRLSLSGDTNLVELSVKTDAGWQAVCPPVALPLQLLAFKMGLIRDLDRTATDTLAAHLKFPWNWNRESDRPAQAGELLDRYSLRATMFVLDKAREFARQNSKKLLVVLFDPYRVMNELREGQDRFDQPVVDSLTREKSNCFDMNEVQLRDFQKQKLPYQEYMKQCFIGHYNPRGNHLFAYAIKDTVVEWLDPKPITYRNPDPASVDFRGYLPDAR